MTSHKMACVTGDFRALDENEGYLSTKMRSKSSRNFSFSLFLKTSYKQLSTPCDCVND